MQVVLYKKNDNVKIVAGEPAKVLKSLGFNYTDDESVEVFCETYSACHPKELLAIVLLETL